MYESYTWPGACHRKSDRKLIIKWVKELFDGLVKEIAKTEKKI